MIALALHGRYDVVWEVLNSADFNVAQSRKRVYIIGFHREKCSGKVLSFTDANPKTLVKRISGREGNRVYSADGLSITLTSQAGGFGGKTGLYEIIGLPIKSKTKSGYQIALPGDSIDLAYPNMNSRRGRVGKEIAHTLTTTILSIKLDTLTARILKLSSDSHSRIEPAPLYSGRKPADRRADPAVAPVAHEISPDHRF